MTDPADPLTPGADAYRTDPVASQPEELRRIMSTGTIWAAAGMIAPALVLGPLLASGWRPVELEFAAFIVWWLGAAVGAIGLCLLIWAGCPVLAYTPQNAYRQKVFCIRVGIVMNVAGMAIAGLVVVVQPHADGIAALVGG
jgi:hypothetical protein